MQPGIRSSHSEPRAVVVSYIISTRNRASYLDRVLSNAEQFLTADDELIVIDGASTDDTIAVIEKHRSIISVFRSEPDIGEAHGFNKGLLLSRGEIVKPLTDDDYFYPEAMRQAVKVMLDNPEIDALQCGGEACVEDSVTHELVVSAYPMLTRRSACGLGLLMRRRMLAQVGLMDTNSKFVDSEYFERLFTCGATFRRLQIKLYRHITYAHSGVLRYSDRYFFERLRTRIYGLLDEPGGRMMAFGFYAFVYGVGRLSHFSFVAALLRSADAAVSRVEAAVRRRAISRARHHRETRLISEPLWDGAVETVLASD